MEMKAAICIVGLIFALTEVVSAQPNPGTDGPIFLSPYIYSGAIQEARDLSLVHGEQFGMNLHSHSAYLTVSSTSINYYFFYFPAFENSRDTAPYLVVLNGGPGRTSLRQLFGEIGPYYVTEDGRVQLREITWLTRYNLLFLDQPAGTGFSFATRPGDLANTTSDLALNLADVLNQFFVLFPPAVGQEVYLLGEGYAAKTSVALAHLVHTSGRPYTFTLTGILSMSGFIDPNLQIRPVDYLYQTSTITDVGRDSINQDLGTFRSQLFWNQYVGASRTISTVVSGIEGGTDSYFKRESGIIDSDTILLDVAEPELSTFIAFIQNSPDLKRVLHVGPDAPFNADSTSVTQRFVESGDFARSLAQQLQDILNLDVKVLIFTGNMDPLLTPVAQSDFARSLQWKCRDRFNNVSNRQIWRVRTNDRNSAGYVKCACTFCLATVRNAGHYIPTEEPIRALDLVDRFINNRNFGTYVVE